MKPVIALVGRPNVGKSTLFNCLTRSRDALVADYPGLTRDRQYGNGRVGDRAYIVIDTGGLTDQSDELDGLMAQQARQAISEADVVLWLVDARDGLTATDQSIAGFLRRSGKPFRVIVNKIDGLAEADALADFYSIGSEVPIGIAASHNRGIGRMIQQVLSGFADAETVVDDDKAPGVRVALVGRPNVGKSTLTNRLVGEQRVVAFDQPGTTRDSIFVPLERDGRTYTLIDTAGIRRRGKVFESIEKFSVVKALQAIAEAHVVVLLIDAQETVAEQDLALIGQVLEHGKALIIAVNKWDGLPQEQREKVRSELDRRLSFLDFAEVHFISALHGSGVGLLFEAVDRAFESAMKSIATPRLSRLLEEAVAMHQPPLVRGRRIKLRYAHQGGKNPPLIVIHGNQLERLPDDYRRYLAHFFRKKLRLHGTPVRIELKSGENPFEGRRNVLTPRQQYRKKRLMRHVKKNR